MTITRKLTSITTAVALAATALAPMTTAANAGGGWHGSGRQAYGYAAPDRRDFDRGRHNYGHRDDGYRYAHRRHKRDNTGKYIAIGLGALVLGIIASEASRH